MCACKLSICRLYHIVKKMFEGLCFTFQTEKALFNEAQHVFQKGALSVALFFTRNFLLDASNNLVILVNWATNFGCSRVFYYQVQSNASRLGTDCPMKIIPVLTWSTCGRSFITLMLLSFICVNVSCWWCLIRNKVGMILGNFELTYFLNWIDKQVKTRARGASMNKNWVQGIRVSPGFALSHFENSWMVKRLLKCTHVSN